MEKQTVYPTTEDIRKRMVTENSVSSILASIIDEETKGIFEKRPDLANRTTLYRLEGERGVHRNLANELSKLVHNQPLASNGRHLYFNIDALRETLKELDNLTVYENNVQDRLHETMDNLYQASFTLRIAGYSGRVAPLSSDLSTETKKELRAPLNQMLYRLAQTLHAFKESVKPKSTSLTKLA